MGACFSNQIKAETPIHEGANSTKLSRDVFPIVSIPSTTRSEGAILRAVNLKSFTLSELRAATGNFRTDSLLGEGHFGCVFKGWVDEHSLTARKAGTGLVIAVKRFNKDGSRGHKEWLAEINYLGQLHHPNLAKLIGYCIEDDHRLLVYEFLQQGSVENHLFRRSTHLQPLPWSIRMKVALGAAKGLAFLHIAERQVIYRDFKTSDILLDSNYIGKLSDFGLAREGPTDDKSHVSTRVVGTHGYGAPEYITSGHLTTKCDVYSFGVVLLELLCGRRVIDNNRPRGEQNLVEWARPYLINKNKTVRILDARLGDQYSVSQALEVAKLALRCISREAKFRPGMDEVVTALEQIHDSDDKVKGANKESRSWPFY